MDEGYDVLTTDPVALELYVVRKAIRKLSRITLRYLFFLKTFYETKGAAWNPNIMTDKEFLCKKRFSLLK